MPSIDSKVVQLLFDNEGFEKGTKETQSMLQKMNQTIETGFKNMGASLDSLASKVSGVGTVIFGFLTKVGQDFANLAMNSIRGLVGSFSQLDGIIAGYNEYETKLNSVQTILANTQSKGTVISDVTTALDDLNHYADLTIYNFGEMTRNIGTFTAAGVDLDIATKSIKGIANLAAMSGSSSQQASTAMYQLSQAIAAGSVKLMDWNSVVNAGMGGEVFQQALMKTARNMGVGIDQIIEKNGTFRQSLQEGWLTSEILTTTLEELTLTTSDYNKELLMNKGYSEEDAIAIMKQADTAQDAATKVKTFTQLLGTIAEGVGSGWAKTFELIIGDFEEAKELWSSVYKVIGDFNDAMADSRNEMFELWKELGGRTQVLEGLQNAFSAIGDTITNLGSIFKSVTGFEFVSKDAADRLFALSEQFNNWSKTLDPLFSEGSAGFTYLTSLFEGIKTVIDPIVAGIKELWSNVKNLFSIIKSLGEPVIAIFETFNNELSQAGDNVTFFSVLGSIFESLFGIINKVIAKVVELINGLKLALDKPEVQNALVKAMMAIKTLLNAIGSIFSGLFGIIKSVFDIFFGGATNGASSGEIFATVITFIANALTTASNFLTTFVEGIKGATTAVRDFFAGFVSGGGENSLGIFGRLQQMFEKLLPFLQGVFKTIMNIFQNFNLDRVYEILGAIFAGGMIVNVIKFFKSFNDGFGGLKDLLSGLTGILDSVSEAINSFSLSIKAKALKEVALALLILAGALFIMATLDAGQIVKSMSALGTGLIGMMESLQLMSGIKGLKTQAVQLIALSGALLIMALALRVIGTMNVIQISASLTALAVGLAEMALATQFVSGKGMGSLLVMAIAIQALSMALLVMGTMPFSNLMQGLLGVAIALEEMILATKLMTDKDVLSLIAMAGALDILALGILVLGTMPLNNMIQGLIGVGVALGMMILSTKLLTEKDALSLMVMATALTLLAVPIFILGTMPLENLIQGLAAIAVALGIFIIAGYAAQPVIGVIVALSAGLLLFGIAVAGIGAGIMMAGIGVLALVAALALLGAAGTAAIPVLISLLGALVEFIIEMIPAIVVIIVESIVGIVVGVLSAADKILAAVFDFLTQLLQSLIEFFPTLFEFLGVFFTELFAFLIEQIPAAVQVIFDLVAAILTELGNHMQEFVEAGLSMVVGIINGIAAKVGDIIQAAFNLLISFIEGLANAIRTEGPRLKAAVQDLIDAIVDFVVGGASDFASAGKGILDGIINGFLNFGSTIWNAIMSFKDAVLDQVASIFGIHSPSTLMRDEVGINLALGIMSGLLAGASSVGEGAKTVGEKVVDGFNEGVSGLEASLSPVITPVIDDYDFSRFDGRASLYPVGEYASGAVFNGDQIINEYTVNMTFNGSYDADKIYNTFKLKLLNEG